MAHAGETIQILRLLPTLSSRFWLMTASVRACRPGVKWRRPSMVWVGDQRGAVVWGSRLNARRELRSRVPAQSWLRRHRNRKRRSAVGRNRKPKRMPPVRMSLQNRCSLQTRRLRRKSEQGSRGSRMPISASGRRLRIRHRKVLCCRPPRRAMGGTVVALSEAPAPTSNDPAAARRYNQLVRKRRRRARTIW